MNLEKVKLFCEAIKAVSKFRNRDPLAKRKAKKKKLARAKCKGPNMSVQVDAAGNYKCLVKNRKNRIKRLVAWKKRKRNKRAALVAQIKRVTNTNQFRS